MTQSDRRIRTTQPLLVLLAGSGVTLAVLLVFRTALAGPTPVGSPAAWTGDELAVTGVWWAALIGSAWLAATTLACIAALAQGRTRTAHRIARFAPPLARRLLQTALIGTWALVPTAAYAAPSPAPITVHVDANGRLSHATTTTKRATAIRRATVTTTTATATTAATTTPTPVTTAPKRSNLLPAVTPLPRAPSTPHALVPIALPTRKHTHVVVRGDNLWRIAQAAITGKNGSRRPTDAQIAQYWWRVIAANRTTLRSGDPNLIFPGEIVVLP
jgi:nucleoid-associated protein YgaU